MSSVTRPISLDPSALSPKEYDAYLLFMSQFESFTSHRNGRLRFAEAAHLLRQWFPFETDREDEIRSFFPQKMQLGEMSLGCVLAILRLLAHVHYHAPIPHKPAFRLHRDLIFIQAEPLPRLPDQRLTQTASPHPPRSVQDSSSKTSNPFRPFKLPKLKVDSIGPIARHPIKPSSSTLDRDLSSTSSSLDPAIHQPFSADDAHPAHCSTAPPLPQPQVPLSNPFRRQRSVSSNPSTLTHPSDNSSACLSDHVLPPVPPRPGQACAPSVPRKPNHLEEEKPVRLPSDGPSHSLPPPKHYTQRLRKQSDGDQDPNLDTLFSSESDTCPISSTFSPNPASRPATALSLSKLPFALDSGQKTPHITSRSGLSSENSQNNSSPIDISFRHLSRTRTAQHHELGLVSLLPDPEASNRQEAIGKGLPPLPPTKPSRPTLAGSNRLTLSSLNEAAVDSSSASDRKTSLTRAQTLSHPHHSHRPPPPVPPPRKRPESFNSQSVPSEQLATLTASLDQMDNTQSEGRTLARTMSNLMLAPDFAAKDATRRIEKRTVSLFDATEARNMAQRKEEDDNPYLRQLKALEVGLRQDGKDLVREVKEGWVSRHGERDERVPLVEKSESEPLNGKNKFRRPLSGHRREFFNVNGHKVPRRLDEGGQQEPGENQAIEELGWNRLE